MILDITFSDKGAKRDHLARWPLTMMWIHAMLLLHDRSEHARRKQENCNKHAAIPAMGRVLKLMRRTWTKLMSVPPQSRLLEYALNEHATEYLNVYAAKYQSMILLTITIVTSIQMPSYAQEKRSQVVMMHHFC
jgi:hypothetical protein